MGPARWPARGPIQAVLELSRPRRRQQIHSADQGPASGGRRPDGRARADQPAVGSRDASLAESALRAVRRCNPLRIPAQYPPTTTSGRAACCASIPSTWPGNAPSIAEPARSHAACTSQIRDAQGQRPMLRLSRRTLLATPFSPRSAWRHSGQPWRKIAISTSGRAATSRRWSSRSRRSAGAARTGRRSRPSSPTISSDPSICSRSTQNPSPAQSRSQHAAGPAGRRLPNSWSPAGSSGAATASRPTSGCGTSGPGSRSPASNIDRGLQRPRVAHIVSTPSSRGSLARRAFSISAWSSSTRRAGPSIAASAWPSWTRTAAT